MDSIREKVGSMALGAALVLGGAAGAYALTNTASAQSTPTTSATASDSTAAQNTTKTADKSADNGVDDQTGDSQRGHGGPDGQGGGPHVANGITEAPLSGDQLSKATAAAQAAVAGATVDRAETDAEGAAFEVHMTKADGSHVTVKLDASFNVTSTEDGMK